MENEKICTNCKKPHTESTRRCKHCKDTISRRKQRLKLRSICTNCGIRSAQKGKVTCSICIKIQSSRNLTKRDKNQLANLCRTCGKNKPKLNCIHCPDCLFKSNKVSKKQTRLKKDKVYNAYGGYKCSCCGETNEKFLTIDHINNNGARDREEMRKEGRDLYTYIIKNSFPSDLQILCMNCNWAKRYGACPHQKDLWLNTSIRA